MSTISAGVMVVYGALMRLHNVRYYQGVVERGTSDSSNTITLTMVTLCCWCGHCPAKCGASCGPPAARPAY